MPRPIEEEPGYKTLTPEQQRKVSEHYRRIQAEKRNGKPPVKPQPKARAARGAPAPKKKSFLRSVGEAAGRAIVKGGRAYIKHAEKNAKAPRKGRSRSRSQGSRGTVVHVHVHGGGGSGKTARKKKKKSRRASYGWEPAMARAPNFGLF